MPKRIQYDNNKLISMVSSGTPQKQIMEEFGFGNSSQLKVAYANALMEEGKAPEIMAGSRKASQGKPEVTVSKRGSVSIPKNVVADLGFAEGDTFAVRKTKAGISLKRVVTES